MVAGGATYAVELGFTSPSEVIPDEQRPPLLRARPRAAAPYGDAGIEHHVCDAVDWGQDETVRLDLSTFGFDEVELTEHADLQEVFAEARASGHLSDEAGAAIRASLTGAVLRASGGRRLEVLHVADEGLIMRTGGPNRLTVTGPREKGMNGHRPATSVHTDQDVHGTPLLQLMDGRAPELFRHDSPDGRNHDAALMLVNLWIPLQQITRPLVLADGRSIDRLAHQLRFGLPTDSFLDRDADQNVNDIWTYLHHPEQRWYFRSELDHRRALVFDTLSTPHSAAVLPGEDVAERCYLALEAAEAAAEAADVDGLSRATADAASLEVPAVATPALIRAIADMVEVLREAAADPGSIVDGAPGAWVARSRAARHRVVRMSIELRMVVAVGDDHR